MIDQIPPWVQELAEYIQQHPPHFKPHLAAFNYARQAQHYLAKTIPTTAINPYELGPQITQALTQAGITDPARLELLTTGIIKAWGRISIPIGVSPLQIALAQASESDDPAPGTYATPHQAALAGWLLRMLSELQRLTRKPAFISTRSVAQLYGCDKSVAAAAFHALVHNNLIRPTKKATRKHATEYQENL